MPQGFNFSKIKNGEKILLQAVKDNPLVSNTALAKMLVKDKPFDQFNPHWIRIVIAEIKIKHKAELEKLAAYKAKKLGKIPQEKEGGKGGGPIKTDEFKETGDSAEITKTISKQIKTLEELVKVCEIDLDVWEVERWVCNKWESFFHSNDREKHTVVPLFQVKVWLKKNKARIESKAIYGDLIADAKKFAPRYKEIKYPKIEGGTLLEVDMLDFHLGRKTWFEETGEDSSLERSEEEFMFCLREIVAQARAYKVERILFPVGNDFFNSDNHLGTTTSGTRQKDDPIWRRTYRFGRKLMVKAIDELQLIAPVDVLIIPGNHDMERAFYLGDGLECWYHKHAAVKVDNGPRKRKYYEYGKCLIGFAHGKTEKINEMPTLMATEAPEKFGRTKFKEFHLGDKHHEKKINWISIDENRGVVVRILRSLALPDEWTIDNGYIGSQRSAEGFIWDKERGMRAHLFVNL